MKLKLYFVSGMAVTALFSSCASFENLTDDRTRLEDDEMYWNRKEMFFDPFQYPVSNKSVSTDDYYDPNSRSNYSNQYSGATNPVATFNPLSGWQMSYGLSTFNNYYPGFGSGMLYGMSNMYNYGYGMGYYPGVGIGLGSQYGYGYGMSNFCNPYGGGYYGSYSPFYNGYYGNSYYNPWYVGHSNPYYNNGGGYASNGDAPAVTHFHRTPPMVGSTNNSSYQNGVLRKNIVAPVSVASRNPVEPARSIPGVRPPASHATSRMPNTASRPDSNNDYYNGNASNPSRSTGVDRSSGYSSPSYTAPSHSSPSRSGSEPSHNSPSYSSPSRSTPSHSSPSHSSPSHSSPSPSRSTPSHSSSPGRR